MFDPMTRSYLKVPFDDMTTNRYGSTQTIQNQVTADAVEFMNLRMTAAWGGQAPIRTVSGWYHTCRR